MTLKIINFLKTVTLKAEVFAALTLREKCLYSELFWSVFSPNAGKYGPENYEYGLF